MTERTPKEEIEAIKKENLSGRQLRMARKLAVKQGLSPRSDLDAVRLLRKSGIEPFGTYDPGGSTAPGGPPESAASGGALTSAPKSQLTAEERELSIRKIQLDLVRRRRRRIFATFARLFVFIALPTIIAGHYFANRATPIYSSHSKFVVQTAGAPTAAPGGTRGALPGMSEAISVQSYLESRPVMIKLDEEYDFRALFEDPNVDALQRLDPEATNEEAHRLYGKRVKLSFDPTQGVIGLEVATPDPVASFEISNILRGYAEEHVRNMTARAEADNIAGAQDNLKRAEEQLAIARERVLQLQSEKGLINAETEIGFLTSEINSMRQERSQLQVELEELRLNPRPNPTRVAAIERQLERLETRITENQEQLTQGSELSASLTRVQSELASAETEVALRQSIVAAAFSGLEAARLEARSRSVYLNRAVDPVIADDATYPKVFENTLLAFLIFGGIYLLISITYAILREQMTT
ncbi:MAG: capsule biosynthesis protein [Pseudomonadota bacterium]